MLVDRKIINPETMSQIKLDEVDKITIESPFINSRPREFDSSQFDSFSVHNQIMDFCKSLDEQNNEIIVLPEYRDNEIIVHVYPVIGTA